MFTTFSKVFVGFQVRGCGFWSRKTPDRIHKRAFFRIRSTIIASANFPFSVFSANSQVPFFLRTHSRLETMIVYASGMMRFMACYTRQTITWIVVLKILAQNSDEASMEVMESLPAQDPSILKLMVPHSGW